MKLSATRGFLAVAVSSAAAYADVPCASRLGAQTVELEDGVYHLDAPLVLGTERSGTPEKPLLVRAKNRGKDFVGLYLSDGRTSAGGRHVRVTGMDVLSDTPAGTALLDGILDYLVGR